MANPLRYRYVDFIGGRTLEARELALLQDISAGQDPATGNDTALDLDAIYRDGALMNVSCNISALTVTLQATNNALPMYVFIRGRWETFPASGDTMPAITFPNTGGFLYLNWVLRQVSFPEDSTLVDSNGNPTADMGELDLSISSTDLSSSSLNTGDFEKNTDSILLFTLSPNGTGSLTATQADNVFNQAKATLGIGGPVTLTTSTSSGIACASDDFRLSNTRTPSPNSIIDPMVVQPIAVGFPPILGTPTKNLDGTQQYPVTTASPYYGIDSNKIIYNLGTQTVQDALSVIKTNLAWLTDQFVNHHEGMPLNSTGSFPHPMPSASQVGAAPVAHMTQPLSWTPLISGVPTHPPTTTSNTTGFTVNRTLLASEGTIPNPQAAFATVQTDGIDQTNGFATTISTTNLSDLIIVASATGITAGQLVYASGVTPGTTVVSTSGTTITLSANATATASGVAATFATTAGPEMVNALMHNGDIFSNLTALLGSDVVAAPIGTNPAGGGALTTGSLELYSILAQVVQQHVAQTITNNPHGLDTGFSFVPGELGSGFGSIVFPSWLGGFTIQWGTTVFTHPGHNNTITVSPAFNNTIFGGFATDNGSGSTSPGGPFGVAPLNQSQFQINMSSAMSSYTSLSVFWCVVGY